MTSAVVQAYRLALWLYPPAFRRRYADEMRLDFEDGLRDAVAGGVWVALLFVGRTVTDTAASLLREWSQGRRVAAAAAAAGITIALWGLALRPWTWKGSIRPQSLGADTATPVEVWTLIVIAAVTMALVVALIVLGPRLVRRAR